MEGKTPGKRKGKTRKSKNRQETHRQIDTFKNPVTPKALQRIRITDRYYYSIFEGNVTNSKTNRLRF